MLLPITLRARSSAARSLGARLAGALAGAARALRAALVWCARCHARAEQRRALAALDDEQLRDVGITRAQALAESAKPWWRA